MPGSRWDDDTEFEVDIDDDSAPEARLVEVESTPAPAAGEPVVLSLVPISVDDIVTLRIGSDLPTGFTLDIYLNAALEGRYRHNGT